MKIATLQQEEKEGYILFFTMGMMAVLSIFGLLTFKGAMLESKAAANQIAGIEALYHADAGAKMVKLIVEKRFETDIDLETALAGLSVSPTGSQQFGTISSFTVTVPKRAFEFEVTGWSGTASRTLHVRYLRPSAFSMGMFGDKDLDLDNHLVIYGYDSSQVQNPSSSDSNGGAAVGSNENVNFKSNFGVLDGYVQLGQTIGGTDATISGLPAANTADTVGRVDPDPLGINGGALHDEFEAAILSNNNAANSFISGTDFSWTKHDSDVTLTSGDYYLTNVYGASDSELTIDSSSGPVRLFVDGPVQFKPNSTINSDVPANFQIFVRTNDSLKLYPSSSANLMLYAPNSEIDAQPNGSFQGIIWGSDVNTQPSGTTYIDTTLMNAFLLNRLNVLSWKEISDL